MAGAADVVVVGAGIVGAACADALARSQLDVVVVDAGECGDGATAACMGHIVVMDDSDAQMALTSYSRELWQRLAPLLPSEAQWDACGTLWLAQTDAELEKIAEKQRYYAAAAVAARLVEAAELRQLEPELRAGLPGALVVAGDASVYPPVVTAWLLARAARHGAQLRYGTAVQAVDEHGVRLRSGEALRARYVVVAAGIDSLRLLPAHSHELTLLARKGHLAITDRYPRRVQHQLVELGYLASAHALHADSVAFNLQPRSTGQLLFGSSRQFSATPGVDTQLLARMLRRALDFVPGLENTQIIRSWVGFRPATPDKLPFIGALPLLPQVLLATGHEGLGITTSLATAELISDIVLGRTSSIARDVYAPGRIAPRAATAATETAVGTAL